MSDITISLDEGQVLGTQKNGIMKFQGVPYCVPPIGELRWKSPVALAKCNAIRDCRREASILPQGPSDLDAPMGPIVRSQDEGALTLAISAPSDHDKPLPVAVWFHGGANFCGAGNAEWYDGERLAQRGMVVVGVNYRLGALGFLQYPGLNDRNLAIEDQIMALRWVQTNISAFGGDPTQVTVFGQSAGGNSIVHMMSLPETEGLFSQCVLMSPSIGRGNHVTEDAHCIARELLTALGCNVNEKATLRAQALEKTTTEILRATDICFQSLGAKFGGMLFKPVKDEWATPEATAKAAVREAARRGLKIVIGTTHDETLAFSADRSSEVLDRLAKVQRERFDEPAAEFAALAAEAGVDIHKYRFNWKGPKSIYGACHCIDLPFLFGTFEAWNAPMLAGADATDVAQVSESMQSFFARFVKEGTFDDSWPSYTRLGAMCRIFDSKTVTTEPFYVDHS